MNASPSSSIGASRRAAPVAEPLRRHVASLLAGCKPGFALPGAFFTDEVLYAAELEYIFGRHWLFVASEPEIPEGGDYRTFQIGPWPVFIVRRDDGSIAAFHNTCRHRGSRILLQDSGIAGATLQCPYHRWTYDLDGRVIGCGATGEAPAAQRRLKPVHVKTLAGLIFVCVADEPPDDFDDMAQRMIPYLAPHGLARAKVAKQVDIIEHGNWKLTIENNRECFHCAPVARIDRTLRACRRRSVRSMRATGAPARRPRRSGGARACRGSASRSCTAGRPHFAPSGWCSTAPVNP